MDFAKYVSRKSEEIIRELASSLEGLTNQEAQDRLKKNGSNKFSIKEKGIWNILLRQLKSSFIYLLLGASVLAFLLREYWDSAMIMLFVFINTVLGFYQEYQSEKAVKLLKKHLTKKIKVKRDDAETEISSEELVIGDVVILEPGNIVPADMRLLQAKSLALDESLLTGESVTIEKTDDVLDNKAKEVHQATNMVFSGTTVVRGKGLGLVVTTGKDTVLGNIAKLTGETARKSIFEKEIAKFSKFILRLVIVTIVLMFFGNLLVKGLEVNIGDLTLFSIALVVSAIPEALPVVTTFAFSRGALKLAKKHVIVKRLAAVEDLGGIEVLCTDKTGTLTENSMKVSETFSLYKEDPVFYACLGSSFLSEKKELTNPFDIAILERKLEKKKTLLEYKKQENIPFDPERKRDTTLLERREKYEVITRGAPETIIELCKLSSKEKKILEKWMVEKGIEGKRVWAIAKGTLTKKPSDLKKAEKELKCIGLISFVDPIKKSVNEAVEKAQKLGITIKILTGDRKEIAQAVANNIGLISDQKEIITGSELDKLSFQKRQKFIESCKVFARVSPQQKYEIIQSLQKKYKVGFLGDGINDAPALKLANVALAVQEATDVSREAADIILLRKDLKIIIDGIKEGREIFVNTTKYIIASLSANFGNFYAVAAASLMINVLPMLPTQILLVNLLSDFPMIAIASDNVDETEVKKPQSYDLKSILYLVVVLGLVSSGFDFITFAIFSKWSTKFLQTSWYMESILTELVFIFSIRTRLFFLKAKSPSLILGGFISLAALLTIGLPLLPEGQKVFSFISPQSRQLTIILGLVVSYFVVTELVKLMFFKISDNGRNGKNLKIN